MLRVEAHVKSWLAHFAPPVQAMPRIRDRSSSRTSAPGSEVGRAGIGWLVMAPAARCCARRPEKDRKSTRLNSSHGYISYAVFCLKKKKKKQQNTNILSTITNTLRQVRTTRHT